MGTTRSFQSMLTEYLPENLLKDELIQRDYILSNTEKDNSWKGGKLIVPFKASGASSVRMGKLTAGNDISQDSYVRGSIDDYKEAWGSMIFNHRDLMEHNGKITESTFLKILPDTIEDFMEYMKMVVSIQLGTGPHFAKATASGTAGGVVIVDRVDRFCLGQKVTLRSDLVASADFYVIAIDVNTNAVTFSATRGGAAADVSVYLLADNTKLYTDDADIVAFQSIRDGLLSLANGGTATIHGQSKIAYPFLQAINIDGTSWTGANILDKLFDGYNEVRKKAKGNAKEILCSYTIGGAILKAVENKTNGQAQWNVQVMDKKASLYGWDEIVISSVKGNLKVVMIQEWDDDVLVYRDPASMIFRSNGMFEKRKSPDGLEYYETRGEDGYQYIIDISLFGELEIRRPGNNGIVHSIDPANF